MIFQGYFESLRNEKPNINVNLYCPGPTFSNFLQEAFVETPGQKYNQPVQATDKRMTTERCAYLYAVALANNTGLCWSGMFPINWIAYIGLYYPNIKRLWVKFQIFLLLHPHHICQSCVHSMAAVLSSQSIRLCVMKFSNLNIFFIVVVYSHIPPQIAGNCRDEAFAKSTRRTLQQCKRSKSSLETKIGFFSIPHILFLKTIPHSCLHSFFWMILFFLSFFFLNEKILYAELDVCFYSTRTSLFPVTKFFFQVLIIKMTVLESHFWNLGNLIKVTICGINLDIIFSFLTPNLLDANKKCLIGKLNLNLYFVRKK